MPGRGCIAGLKRLSAPSLFVWCFICSFAHVELLDAGCEAQGGADDQFRDSMKASTAVRTSFLSRNLILLHRPWRRLRDLQQDGTDRLAVKFARVSARPWCGSSPSHSALAYLNVHNCPARLGAVRRLLDAAKAAHAAHSIRWGQPRVLAYRRFGAKPTQDRLSLCHVTGRKATGLYPVLGEVRAPYLMTTNQGAVTHGRRPGPFRRIHLPGCAASSFARTINDQRTAWIIRLHQWLRGRTRYRVRPAPGHFAVRSRTCLSACGPLDIEKSELCNRNSLDDPASPLFVAVLFEG